MILECVKENDPILMKKLDLFNFDDPLIDPKELFENMKDTLIHKTGWGLSANQVGINTQMFVMGDSSNTESIFSVFNPKIVNTEGDEIYFTEGCISFPHLWISIKRPTIIRTRYTNVDNVTNTIKFEGLTSRIFQHEYDHLNGVKFTKRASLYHLQQGKAKRKKLQRKK